MGEVYTLKEIFDKRRALKEGNTTFTILDPANPSRSITLGKLNDIFQYVDEPGEELWFGSANTSKMYQADFLVSDNEGYQVTTNDGRTVETSQFTSYDKEDEDGEIITAYRYEKDEEGEIIYTKWPNHFIAKGRLTGGAKSAKKSRCKKNYVRVGADCVLKSDVAEKKNATKAAKAMKKQTKQKRCPRGSKRYPPNGEECLPNSARGRTMSARRNGTKKTSGFSPETKSKKLALMIRAIENNDMEGVEALLYEGVDVNSKISNDDDMSILHFACSKGGRTDIAELLINNGADVNNRTKDGSTPLMLTCKIGNLSTYNMLKKKGAEGNC
uniref:Uncharacterized protein n=1 Tax=viral metagenome TaxID=1070528 RepID=A0A6C0I4W4_9ZZZZ